MYSILNQYSVYHNMDTLFSRVPRNYHSYQKWCRLGSNPIIGYYGVQSIHTAKPVFDIKQSRFGFSFNPIFQCCRAYRFWKKILLAFICPLGCLVCIYFIYPWPGDAKLAFIHPTQLNLLGGHCHLYVGFVELGQNKIFETWNSFICCQFYHYLRLRRTFQNCCNMAIILFSICNTSASSTKKN